MEHSLSGLDPSSKRRSSQEVTAGVPDDERSEHTRGEVELSRNGRETLLRLSEEEEREEREERGERGVKDERVEMAWTSCSDTFELGLAPERSLRGSYVPGSELGVHSKAAEEESKRQETVFLAQSSEEESSEERSPSSSSRADDHLLPMDRIDTVSSRNSVEFSDEELQKASGVQLDGTIAEDAVEDFIGLILSPEGDILRDSRDRGITLGDSSSTDEELCDPITREIFDNPVVTPCQHVYSADSILQWLATGNASCPMCRAELHARDLKPSHSMRQRMGMQEMCSDDEGFEELIKTAQVQLGPAHAQAQADEPLGCLASLFACCFFGGILFCIVVSSPVWLSLFCLFLCCAFCAGLCGCDKTS